MTTATTAALAFVLSSYAKSEATPAKVEVKETSKPRAKRQPKVQVQSAPVTPKVVVSETTPSPNGATAKVVMPQAGSLEAKGFLMMMRNAKSQNEKIMAIAAFVGYDAREPFGNQEMVAMMRAKRDLRPIDTSGPSLVEKRQASLSAKGYVAGMPDNQRRIVQDLLAREKMAAEKRDEHVRIARREKSLSWEERKLNLGLARLEAERLESIRTDLAKHIG